MLAAVFNPFHRTIKFSGEGGDEVVFRVEFSNPEAASYIPDVHYYGVFREIEHGRERGAIEERHFGDAEYGDAPLIGVPQGGKTTRLEGDGAVSLNGEAFAAHIVCGFERRFGVPATNLNAG